MSINALEVLESRITNRENEAFRGYVAARPYLYVEPPPKDFRLYEVTPPSGKEPE